MMRSWISCRCGGLGAVVEEGGSMCLCLCVDFYIICMLGFDEIIVDGCGAVLIRHPGQLIILVDA
jgi:hypothetical protein